MRKFCDDISFASFLIFGKKIFLLNEPIADETVFVFFQFEEHCMLWIRLLVV